MCFSLGRDNTRLDQTQQFDVAVIVAGPAGLFAALRASRLGARTALITRDAVSEMAAADCPVPVRVLTQAARLRREARQLHAFGIDAGETTLDYGRLLDRVRDVVTEVSRTSTMRPELEEVGVVIFDHAGTARFVTPTPAAAWPAPGHRHRVGVPLAAAAQQSAGIDLQTEDQIVRLGKTLSKKGLDAGPETIAAHCRPTGWIRCRWSRRSGGSCPGVGSSPRSRRNAPDPPGTGSAPTSRMNAGRPTPPTGDSPTAPTWRSLTFSMTLPGQHRRQSPPHHLGAAGGRHLHRRGHRWDGPAGVLTDNGALHRETAG